MRRWSKTHRKATLKSIFTPHSSVVLKEKGLPVSNARRYAVNLQPNWKRKGNYRKLRKF